MIYEVLEFGVFRVWEFQGLGVYGSEAWGSRVEGLGFGFLGIGHTQTLASCRALRPQNTSGSESGGIFHKFLTP